MKYLYCNLVGIEIMTACYIGNGKLSSSFYNSLIISNTCTAACTKQIDCQVTN